MFLKPLCVTLPIVKLNSVNRLINWSLTALFFLVPLFFTSVNYELFEFNKILLVYLFASFNLCLWILKKYVSGNWKVDKSPFDIFLLIFLAGQALSFIFSIDRHTSFFGYYSRFNGGLLSLIAYAVIYKVIADQQDIRLVKQLIYTTLISGTIVALYAILEHFGYSFSCLMFTGKFNVACWIQDVQNRVYATLGQPNWLAAYLIVLIPLTWALTLIAELSIKNKELSNKFLYRFMRYSVFCILYSTLLFTKSRSGFLGFAVSFALFWSLALFQLKKQTLKPFVIFTSLIIILAVVFGTPFGNVSLLINKMKPISFTSQQATINNQQPAIVPVSPGPQLEVGGTESGEIRKIVWKGAIEIFKHYPLLGSGPETFAYSYYQFRPIEHNLVSEWDFLYNKAHNEYLNYLATTGAIGLGAYLLFCGTFLVYVIKSTKSQIPNNKQIQNNNIEIQNNRLIAIALLSGFIGILVSNFFGFSVVVSNLYLFTIPAMVSVLLTKGNQSSTSNPQPSTPNPNISVISYIICISVISAIFWQIINLWRADYYYNKGDKLSKQQLFLPAYEALNQAYILNRTEPTYQIDMAFAAANLAVAALSAENPDATTASQLVEIAVIFSDQASRLSPFNMNLLKTKIKTLYALSLIDAGYYQKTVDVLLDATRKAPTDPKLVYNLGLMYGKGGDVNLAIETIQQSLEMKPNFADARNALAQYYETLQLYPQAIEQLEYISKNINPDDQTIKDRIEALKALTP